jgi:oligoribonuclease
MQNEQRLIWVDMEMTGLDPDEDVVIEIASIVTNTDLDVLAEGPVIAIHQSDATLARMDEWNTRTHGESGLIERVRASSFDEAAATALTLQFYREWVEPNTSPMCGNSIGQDRRFMARHMPELAAFFHYRNLDVTTLKLLAGYWRPDLPAHSKKNAHEALADIRESIEELRYYRGQLIQG